MATYKGEKGFTIQTIAGDPPAPILGQVWYNTTSNVLKGYASVAGAWASGGDYPTTQSDFTGAGTTTAAVAWGGETPPRQLTSTYDGTSWTTSSPLNYPTDVVTQAGFGLQTAAISAGGYVSGVVNTSSLFNGSTWSGIPNMNTTRQQLQGIGTATAGLIFGGWLRPGGSSATEEYDGTCWASTGNLGTSTREGAQHIGTQTAGIAVAGGTTTALIPVVQEYDGATWSDLPAVLNTSRFRAGGSGTSTDAIVFGGATIDGPVPAPVVRKGLTESFNGTSWTEIADLATARSNSGTAGTTATSALCIAGLTEPQLVTEEWTVANAAKTVTVS